jgi:hypothetical protein
LFEDAYKFAFGDVAEPSQIRVMEGVGLVLEDPDVVQLILGMNGLNLGTTHSVATALPLAPVLTTLSADAPSLEVPATTQASYNPPTRSQVATTIATTDPVFKATLSAAFSFSLSATAKDMANSASIPLSSRSSQGQKKVTPSHSESASASGASSMAFKFQLVQGVPGLATGSLAEAWLEKRDYSAETQSAIRRTFLYSEGYNHVILALLDLGMTYGDAVLLWEMVHVEGSKAHRERT